MKDNTFMRTEETIKQTKRMRLVKSTRENGHETFKVYRGNKLITIETNQKSAETTLNKG